MPTLDDLKDQLALWKDAKKIGVREKARPTVVLADNGKTCKDCKHVVRRRYDKIYLKCGLNRNRWTQGTGTDIRLRDPACAMFEEESEAAEWLEQHGKNRVKTVMQNLEQSIEKAKPSLDQIDDVDKFCEEVRTGEVKK